MAALDFAPGWLRALFSAVMAASFLWIQTDVKGVTIANFRIDFSGSPVFVMLMLFSILFRFACVYDGLVCRVQVLCIVCYCVFCVSASWWYLLFRAVMAALLF